MYIYTVSLAVLAVACNYLGRFKNPGLIDCVTDWVVYLRSAGLDATVRWSLSDWKRGRRTDDVVEAVEDVAGTWT